MSVILKVCSACEWDSDMVSRYPRPDIKGV